MTIKKREFQKGVRLKPDDVALEGVEGEIKVGDTSKKIETHLDGTDREVLTDSQTQTVTNKDIDADNNTVSNLETDNLKAGVLVTTIDGSATDTQIPSAKAVNDALDGQNEASEISYDDTGNTKVVGSDVQAALDSADTEIQANATGLADHIADPTDAHAASAITNTPSGNLTATDIQGAVNELQGDIDTINGANYVNTFNTRTGDVVPAASDYDADQVDYDNATSGLTATEVQAAIDEVDGNLDTHVAASSGVHGVTGSVVGTTDTQTLTNKTIQGASNEDPDRADVKKDTKANLETYALTATNGQLVFATDTKQMFQIVDNALVSVGSGGGGLDVYSTETFETLSTGDFESTGNNASFDGGGTLDGALSDETASPISGDQSPKYTAGSSSNNDYFEVKTIDLDDKQKGETSGVTVYADMSNFANDVTFVVYDVTNATVISSGLDVFIASQPKQRYAFSFNIPSNCNQLSFGCHVNNGAVNTESFTFDDVEFSLDPFKIADLSREEVIVYDGYTTNGSDGRVRFANLKDDTGSELISSVSTDSTVITFLQDCDFSITGSYIGVNSSEFILEVRDAGNTIVREARDSSASNGVCSPALQGRAQAGWTVKVFSSQTPNNSLSTNLTVKASKVKGYVISEATPLEQIAYIKDVKANNSAGGTFTSGAWQTRDLNTNEGDTFVTLSSNQFTLPSGKYDIQVIAPGHFVNLHKVKLYNITDASDEIIGSSARADDAGATVAISTDSVAEGTITLTEQKTFEVRHRCSRTQATNGFGIASNFGVNEVYTQVKIRKIR